MTSLCTASHGRKKKKKTKQESEKEMGSHLEDFSLQISK